MKTREQIQERIDQAFETIEKLNKQWHEATLPEDRIGIQIKQELKTKELQILMWTMKPSDI